MNKYTKKILLLIKKTDICLQNIDINANKFINKIMEICKNNLEKDIIIKDTKIIELKKLHNKDEYPLLYYYLIKDNMSFVNFLNWFNKTQQNINYKDSMNKELHEVIFNPIEERKILHDMIYSNNFVALNVSQYAEITDLFMETINYDNIKITLIYSKKVNNLQEIKKKVIRVIKIMDDINTSYYKKIDKFIVNIFLTPLKKMFSTKELILTPMNINSGSAISGRIVNIWRLEELEKVLIHELQHYLSFDFHMYDNNYDKVNNIIKNYFNVYDDNNKCNESYNETLAGIINMCYQSCKYRVKINTIYYYEMSFLILQTLKIIKHYNKDTDIYNIADIKIKQTTSCLSYYVIKTILFFNILKFLTLIENNGIKCQGENINKYGIFLEEILNSKDDIKSLNEMINEMNNKIDKLKIDKNNFVMKTLRMSAISD
jgi:hypothetical protein